MKTLKFLPLAFVALILAVGCEKDSSGSGKKSSTVTESEYQFTNPVLYQDAPDPSVILAHDGNYYLYSTASYLHIYSSPDLVNWKFEKDVFSTYTRPNGTCVWAPDQNYVDGRYLLYYTMDTGDATSRYINVMTSDEPAGTYEQAGTVIDYDTYAVRNSIDECYWEEPDGSKYMFWGSFNGIYVIPLSSDGLSGAGSKQQMAGSLIEGTMICKHDGYYYMIGSAGSYTGGESSTYHLVVARSTDLLGPYRDRDGGLATSNQFSKFLNASDETFGPGHNSEVLEMSDGTTWFMYHGYTYHNINYGRVVYLSQIFWDNTGWPYVVLDRPSITWDKPPVNSVPSFSYSAASYMEFQGQDKEAHYAFDTGYVPNADTRVEMKIQPYSKTGSGGSSSGSLRRIFQASESSDSGFSLYISSDGKFGFSNYGNDNSSVADVSYDTDYEISATISSVTINGQDYSLSGGTTDKKWERINLFGGLYDNPFMGRIYYFKIYEGNTLIHNYEPVRRNNDGVVMLHDSVTGTYILPFDAEGFDCGN